MIEFGIVKFFNGRYGTIEVVNHSDQKTGEELFFYHYDSRFVSDFHGSEPTFCEPGERPWGVESLQVPREGDKLVFERVTGEGGKDKASPWGHAKVEYDLFDNFGGPFEEATFPVDAHGFLPYWKIADLQVDESEVISLEAALRSPNRHFRGDMALAQEAGELHPRDIRVRA